MNAWGWRNGDKFWIPIIFTNNIHRTITSDIESLFSTIGAFDRNSSPPRGHQLHPTGLVVKLHRSPITPGRDVHGVDVPLTLKRIISQRRSSRNPVL